MLCRTTTTEPWAEGRTAHALLGAVPRQKSFALLASVSASSDGERPGDLDHQDSDEKPKHASSRGRRVLLVDDDEDVQAIMVPFLEEEGFEVSTAMTGRDAILMVARDKPDVVILDLMMPVVSGWDVWDHMQQSPELSRIPVVVFTACGLGPGAFGATVPVVRKGASTEEILNALARSLGAP